MTNAMPKVAVLDDDERWCIAIQRFFRASFEVTTFTDAQSFLNSALESYDLVIIDFTIAPHHRHETPITGIEIIHQLKTQLKRPPLTILTSAFISRGDLTLDNAFGLQVDVVMPKDCGLDEILQTVQNLLSSKTR
ncbi:MAG: response regulator [Stenomitos rutilans HA7619-LM2]|jgi:CheY-like chemotaxis protein|nr:response regulator [Stenomitos rutilans HA7619-LM2]